MVAPAASPRLLLDELSAAGWGPLRGREGHATRHVLTVLVRGASARATLVATANQVADRAGVSTRHARRCLHLLEDLGLITWTRGHIERGKPRPGWFRVRLTALRHLVEQARAEARERTRERRAQTQHRIRTTVHLHTLWTRKKRQTPLSVHADMASILPLYEGKRDAEAPPSAASLNSPPPATTGNQAMHHCAAHNIPVGQCAICRKTLERNPDLDVKKLWAPIPTEEERIDYAETARRGRAAARAAARQAAYTQDALN